MNKSKASVFLVDDHPLVREWLTNLIHQQPDLTVCGEAETASDALEAMTKLKPDVAIIDISLKGGSGIELIKDLKATEAGVAVIVLSMHDESLYAERALRAGARGYIMKREAAKKIIDGIRTVMAGQLCLSEKISTLMTEKFVVGRTDANVSPIEQLSNRELEVFDLIGRGLTTRQIADHLHVGFKTVQAYSARIKEKLKLANATELLREALRRHEQLREK
jgi:DNA-binding NarL/FixJ family response regulator